MNKKITIIFVFIFLASSAISVTAIKSDSQNINYTETRAMIRVIQQINEKMIRGYIENITSFGPRPTGSYVCEQVAAYLYHEFNDMDLDVQYQNWTFDGISGSNIEATLEGNDISSDEIYIIYAHYDAVPSSPGADDNGAGMAAVLAAAKVMSQYSFDYTVRFVLVSGEEQGFEGCLAYTEKIYGNNDNIVASLNMDQMGYATNKENGNKISIRENLASKWITDVSEEICEQYYKYIQLEIEREVNYKNEGDFFIFWQYGYDSILFIENKINPYHHTPLDSIENMNITYATKVIRLATATLVKLSSNVFNIAGDVFHVGGTGPGNYSCIQDAINIAESGDVVFIHPNIYYENIIIDKAIDLIGEDKETAIIDGNGHDRTILITSNYVRINSLTIRNTGTSGYNSGIDVHSNYTTISGNIISRNGGYGIGIYGFINQYGSCFNDISDNIITDNNDGIMIWPVSNNNLVSNNIVQNNEVCGISVGGGSHHNVISHNTVANSIYGVYFQPTWGSAYLNTVCWNNITKNDNGVFLVYSCHMNTISNNNITYNDRGLIIVNSLLNMIKKNNFIGNNIHAYFEKALLNLWFRNYWSNRTGLQVIQGSIPLPICPNIPCKNIDILSARNPYVIS